MMRNLAASLVLYEAIDTTEAKAKEVKVYVEKILARNKGEDLVTRRTILQTFFDKNAAEKVINELIPRYEKKNSGFIRSFHLKNRMGDNAPMMRLELVDKKVFVDKKPAEKSDIKNEASVMVKEKGKLRRSQEIEMSESRQETSGKVEKK